MKNRVTKRLLSWFMSAVMIVGEFGGMPLSVNAQEDTLIEDETETEETVLDEEAVTEDGVASDAFEEVIINAEDDVVVVEEAKNDPRQAPWVEHPEWWSTWGSQLNYHDGKNTFEAPAFTHGHKTWTDDNGTEYTNDDIERVDDFGYRVYVNKPDAISDDSRWVELSIESETVRTVAGEGNDAVITDTSTIWGNSVLIEMNRKYFEDKNANPEASSLEAGEYDVWIATGDPESGEYYNTNKFTVTFKHPTGNIEESTVDYQWHYVWVSETENGIHEYERAIIGNNPDGSTRYEDDDAIREKMNTEEYADYHEMKMVELSVRTGTTSFPIGYIIKTNPGMEILNWDGSRTNYISAALKKLVGSYVMNCSFIVPADFRIRTDASITKIYQDYDVAKTGKVTAVAKHWYDNLPEQINDLALDETGEEPVYRWSVDGSTFKDVNNGYESHLEWDEDGPRYNMLISSEDPDAAQDRNEYSYLIEPETHNSAIINKNALIVQLVRSMIETELTAGARGDAGLIAGNYDIVIIKSDYRNVPVCRSEKIRIDLSAMTSVSQNSTDLPQALYCSGTDYFRFIADGENRYWQNIQDYYKNDNTRSDDYRNEQGFIDYWELEEELKETYVRTVNAREENKFASVDTLDAFLSSSAEGSVIGYLVRLTDNKLLFDNEGDYSILNACKKGDRCEPARNRETGMDGILEKPITDGKLMVAAIYPDGKISDWCYAHQREWWDELPEVETDLVNTAGTISWTQNTEVRPDYYVKRLSDGKWFEVNIRDTYEYNGNTHKAQFSLSELLLWMAEAKYQGWYDVKTGRFVVEDLTSGEYQIKILIHNEGNKKVSKENVTFSFDASGSRNAAFTVNYNERTTYVEKVQNENGGDLIKHDYSAEGWIKAREYEIGIKETDNNVVGYLINLDGCDIMDPNADSGVRYRGVKAGNRPQMVYTTREWILSKYDLTGIVKVAAVYSDGTMSEWVTAVPRSKADDFESADMGIAYNSLTGEFTVSSNKLSNETIKAKLDNYSIADQNGVPDGYTKVANASVVLRGVEDYEFANRILKKDGNYSADSDFLTVRAAVDELVADGRHTLAPGTYKASFVIWNQDGNVNTPGLASDQEISFIYKNGRTVAAPESVTYRFDEGNNYNVHLVKPVDGAIAYIVRYKDPYDDTTYIYEYRSLRDINENGDFGGRFGYDLGVCAVDIYGNISEFTEAEPEIKGVTGFNTFSSSDFSLEYPIGYNGKIILEGATAEVWKYHTGGNSSMDIYDIAEQTGGYIDLYDNTNLKWIDYENDHIFDQVPQHPLSFEVRLRGGRLNEYNDANSIYLGYIQVYIRNWTIKSIVSTLELDKDSYFVGQIPSLKAGGTVTITYDEGDYEVGSTPRVITVPSAALSLFASEPADMDNGAFRNAGDINLKVLLDGQVLMVKSSTADPGTEVILTANVVDLAVNDITITPPDKTVYFVNEPIEYAGGAVTATWNNGRVENIPLHPDRVTIGDFDNASAGSKNIQVTYENVSKTFAVTVVEPAVERLVITTEPKKMYVEGEAFDPSAGKLTVYREFGDPIVNFSMSSEGVEYPDITKLAPGVHSISISYGGQSAVLSITIAEKQVSTVTLSTEPIKKEYLQGEELDLTNGKITVTYTNAADNVFDLTDIRDQLAISGFRSDVPGNYTVKILYKGRTVAYNIVVKGVTGIELASAPTDLEYFVGQDIDLTGGKIRIIVAGEEEDPVLMDITPEMISGYDKTRNGRQTVTVTYAGRSVTFDVVVIIIAPDRIEMISNPTKTDYYLNENINPAGGKIKVTYNNGETAEADITAAMISGYDKTKAGKQTVTVSFTENGKTVTTTFEVTFNNRVVIRIEIAAKPAKLVYDLNTDLDITGGKIKVVFNNGESETINMTADMISGYDKTKAGKQTITVTYGGKTASFDVTVNAKPEEQQETPDTPEDDYYEFDPTIQEEPVVGEGMKVFFDDASLIPDADGVYHITYTGKAIKPVVRVTDNRVILIEGVDYKVSYKDNVKAGTATVTIKGNGSYDAKETLSFVIDKRSITEAEIGGMVSTRADKVSPVLTFGGKVLVNKKDYKFTIDDGSVEFEGIGSFEGTTSETIEVVTAKELSKLGIKVKFSEKLPEFIYDGTPKTIDEYLVVTDGSKEETAEYSVSYSDNVNAGTVTVWIVGTGSHKGKIKKTFKIKPNKDASFEVSYPKEVKYNVKGAKPYVVVSANETFELLTPGVDYSVKYLNNKKGGATGSFSITFKGNYKGAKYDKDTSFKILKPEMNKAEANVSGNYIITTDMVFKKSGKYQPKTYVIVDGKLLKNSEYTLDYSEKDKLTGAKDNLTITATAKDDTNYAGKAVVSYNVIDGTGKTELNKSKIVLTNSGKSKIYEGAGSEVTLTPGTDFTVKVGSTSIEKAEDITKNFNIYYANNNAVGKATIIVQGKGDYVGLLTKTFTIKKAVIKKK